MIRVSIYLDSAITGKTSKQGSIMISNDGTGSNEVGNYKYTVFSSSGLARGSGEIKGFPRKKNSAIKLLQLCLNDFYAKASPSNN